jgi:uncharacterized protein YodC (DUF2158 family)
MEEDKIYFHPGDVVVLRQIESPKMLVLRKELALFKNNSGLKGIRCRWFTTSGLLQEAVFSTKDLKLV